MSGYLPTKCPRWRDCNANICPLDPAWELRKLLSDEQVCFYLTESVKVDAADRFAAAGLTWVFDACRDRDPAMRERWGRIRRSLERSAGSGSRMETGSDLRERGRAEGASEVSG